jgi:hypothetical protein
LLVGCGDTEPGLKERPASSVKVVPYDAELKSAAVKVFAVNERLEPVGDALATGITDDQGNLVDPLSIKSKSQYVLVAAGGKGSYTEESSGTEVTLKPDDYLYALTYYTSGEDLNITVSGFTHLATAYAQCIVNKQGAQPENAVINAFSAIAGMYSFNPLTTKPRNPTLDSSAGVALDSAGTYGIFAASVSQKMEDISIAQNVTVHQDNYRSIDFYDYAYKDIVEDTNCALDGLKQNSDGEVVTVGIGSTVFDTNTYRVDLSVDAMRFLANPNNVSGILPAAFTLQASQLAQSEHPIFNGAPIIPFDETGPVVTFGRANESWVTGIFDLTATVSDLSGVTSATLYIDDAMWGGATDPANAEFTNINSVSLPDGQHVFRIDAEDSQGNTSSTNLVLIVNNAGPVAELISNKFSNGLTGVFTFQYSDAGAGFKKAQIQGQTINEVDENDQFSVMLNLSPGLNQVTLNVTDSTDVTNSFVIDLVADLSGPNFTIYDPNGSYNVLYSASNDVADTFFDVLDLSNPSWPLYYDDDLVSLNGMAATTTNLNNGKFPYFRVLVDDYQSGLPSGSYTERDDIKVYMDFYVGETKEIDHQLLTPQQINSAGYYLVPLTTEYLTSEFYLVPDTTTLRVVLTSVDLAGNEETQEFDFKLRYFVNPTVVSKKSGPYADTGLYTLPATGDARTAYQTEITNTYPFPIEVKISETADYDATLKFNTNRRVNRVQQTVETHYEFRCSNSRLIAQGDVPVTIDDLYLADKYSTTMEADFQPDDPTLWDKIGGAKGEWVVGKYMQDHVTDNRDLKRNEVPMIGDAVTEIEYLADLLPGQSTSTTNQTFQVQANGYNQYMENIDGSNNTLFHAGWVRSEEGYYVCPTAIFTYASSEVVAYKKVETTSYEQAIGYPRNESVAGSENYGISNAATYNIDHGIEREMTEGYIELTPGQTLYVNHQSVFPAISYKSSTCSYDYAGTNQCNTGMDINLDMSANISFRPKITAGSDTSISTATYDKEYGLQSFSF